MGYSEKLKQLFEGIHLDAVDLLHLESFQIGNLPERVPQKEFATLIRKYPIILNFLISKNPSIESFIHSILTENEEINDKKLIEEYCNELVWEIADLLVYNKFPGIYDKKVKFRWDIKEIIPKESLKGKTVIDVGAGSGMLAFMLAKYAKTVFAVEPISSFRTYIREKAKKEKCKNIYTIDGFLDSIPLPDKSVDILFTSNAIGWNIEDELNEIERVVKPMGKTVHLVRTMENNTENPLHERLVSSDWNYSYCQLSDTDGLKLKYSKTIL